MNVIDYSSFQFDDSSIMSGNVAMQNALMFDSLNPDELSVDVLEKNATGDGYVYTVLMEKYNTSSSQPYVIAGGDLRKYTYGEPLWYYYDGVLQGKYYLRSIERLGVDHYRINAVSLVGILASVQHFGGIYSGVTAGDIIADLLIGYPYTIESDVAAVPVHGWLPIASIRDNLQQVLFAIGASLVKSANGNPHFKFLKDLSPISVGDDRIFIGGKLNYNPPATSVLVTEHSFYESEYDVEVSLFDNTDGSGIAEGKLITFAEPCHSLSATSGLTIGEHGANYAYVSGTGVLTGFKYTHTTRTLSERTGARGETNEATVENATLVSIVNSANVASRVGNYRGLSEEVACGLVMDTDDIKPASLVAFNDPYGEATQGIVSTMNITMSGKSKADCTIVKNYIPSHFGNNFSNVVTITQDGSWAVPDGVEFVRIVLGQGGEAGQNGFNGESGHTPEWSSDPPAKGGDGGDAGRGGKGGKVAVIDLRSPTGQIAFTIGQGGTANTGSGALGNEGGETEATVGGITYSSADGAIPQAGYYDVIGGQLFSNTAEDGLKGANGGTQGKGEDFTFEGRTWRGGNIGRKYESTGTKTRYAYGGRGGGAAYGNDGSNGGDYYWHSGGSAITGGYYVGGDGGRGANAMQRPYTPPLGGGGIGGNGGGGGGIGGYYFYEEPYPATPDYDAEGYGRNGQGGSASLGGNGGGGYALIYY